MGIYKGVQLLLNERRDLPFLFLNLLSHIEDNSLHNWRFCGYLSGKAARRMERRKLLAQLTFPVVYTDLIEKRCRVKMINHERCDRVVHWES